MTEFKSALYLAEQELCNFIEDWSSNLSCVHTTRSHRYDVTQGGRLAQSLAALTVSLALIASGLIAPSGKNDGLLDHLEKLALCIFRKDPESTLKFFFTTSLLT